MPLAEIDNWNRIRTCAREVMVLMTAYGPMAPTFNRDDAGAFLFVVAGRAAELERLIGEVL